MFDCRILITGSRLWRQPVVIHRALESVWAEAHGPDRRPPHMTVVHGGAKGADRIAGDYAKSRGWDVEVHHADWPTCDESCPRSGRHRRMGKFGEYCPTAGHRRNAFMISLGASVVLAFSRDHSGGTANCVKAAHEAGLRVVPYHDCACHPVGQPALFP